ncbi:hypothetical protein SASPL_152003 [Salvia splendens]|uniref:Exostosin GT47 domain-containing protein n=1 Tax=Salvia splendens TaxID=180675 RepID=A0A8X8W2B0_SALSN|nr:xyloglucan galactosyltransferase XLT2-like [Salvia splendens]KAG6386827.1 hypothetical protein SASPL_152003 [Salvia splendens]
MLHAYSPELQSRRKPSKPLNFLFAHPYLWISLASISIPLFIISAVRIAPPCLPRRPAADECPSGTVYVYDLPFMFNHHLLLHSCTDLDNWNWQCGISANGGFGGRAAELRRLLPENLYKSWFRTNQFALEVIFHKRILTHKCRTLEAESATAFYIPFYGGLAVGKHLWKNDTAKRDRDCRMLLGWLDQHEHWKKSNGSDHFISLARITWDFRRLADPAQIWGSTFLNMPEMQRVTRFIIEKADFDDRDVGVPYPTGFHPESREILQNWQQFVRKQKRASLYTFIGAAREPIGRDFRGTLLTYCSNSSSCRVVDCAAAKCSADSSVIMESLLASKFCLQPKGDSFTRRSVFDCMIAGSVPVFFWNQTAYDQYPWFLPGEPESYSVYINHEEVMNKTSVIEHVLKGYSKEEIRKKREKVIETIPRIVYGIQSGGSTDFEDAFDIAIDGVLQRIRKEREL